MTKAERERISRAAEAARADMAQRLQTYMRATADMLAAFSVRLKDAERRLDRLERRLDHE
jgi:hypothetical protein